MKSAKHLHLGIMQVIESLCLVLNCITECTRLNWGSHSVYTKNYTKLLTENSIMGHSRSWDSNHALIFLPAYSSAQSMTQFIPSNSGMLYRYKIIMYMDTRSYPLWSCETFDPVESWESTIQELPCHHTPSWCATTCCFPGTVYFSAQCFSLSLAP